LVDNRLDGVAGEGDELPLSSLKSSLEELRASVPVLNRNKEKHQLLHAEKVISLSSPLQVP